MEASEKIQLLLHHQIDKTKWDEAILASDNSLIYGYSFYLDIMSPGWMALVTEDYNWTLPLTFRKKYGIAYLFQPVFMQQAGVFAKSNIAIPWRRIFENLQKRFSFCEMFWNNETEIDAIPDTIIYRSHTNFVLPLQNSYNTIAKKYHVDLQKNLKRAEKHDLHFCETKDFYKAILMYRNQYSTRFPRVSAQDFIRFENVCQAALQKNMLTVFEVRDNNNECLSIALILKDGKRLYNVMNTTPEPGRKVQANHVLIDNIIRLFAGSEYCFDFEGSDLPGVKSFYKNFGAEDEPYFFIKYNRLPYLLRLIKR